jgi:hypothetical protein
MVTFKAALIGATGAIALAAAPVTSASAHWHHHDGGVVFGLAALGTAAVVGAATILTAPVRALAAPVYAPAPTYYAPYAPPPVYYAPPPVYSYAPPPAAYYPPPGYSAYYGR